MAGQPSRQVLGQLEPVPVEISVDHRFLVGTSGVWRLSVTKLCIHKIWEEGEAAETQLTADTGMEERVDEFGLVPASVAGA